MSLIVLRFLLPALAVGAVLVAGDGDPLVVRSRSEQFVVHSPVLTTPQVATETNRAWILVQPDPLAVSAERIKQRLLAELDAPDRWQGRIHLNLRPELPAGFLPVLTSARFADGWQYSLRIPRRVEREALVRALLQAILTEMANRTPGTRPAELPVWLVHGLAAYFVSGRGPDLAFEANDVVSQVAPGWTELKPTVRIDASDRDISRTRERLAQFLSPDILLRWGDDGIRELRDYFDTQPPLTFNELSLPKPEQIAGEDARRFRASAQLFTLQLLSLPHGPKMMRAFIANLTRTLNWQTTFLGAFNPAFSTAADLEKWWAVSSAGFTSRDESRAWSSAETLKRLAMALATPVRQKPPGQGPPQILEFSPQRLIAELDSQQHLRLLREKLKQLRFVQGRASRDTLGLVTGYADAIARYVEQRPKAGREATTKTETSVNLPILLRSTKARLDALDERRAEAQAALNSPPETTAAKP